MSHNYAKLLSQYHNKGKLGLPEIYDTTELLEKKAAELADLITSSKFCVVFTGAGISTSSGIPDFRGPRGVWTLEGKEEIQGTNFENAKPTYTHFALKALERIGLIKFIISQNVDGLHVLSGFPINRLAELHGNVFVERCDRCKRKYYREDPIGSIGLKATGKNCDETKNNNRLCRGKLHDTTLDWEDELPQPEYHLSQLYSRQSDLSLCLGTTLQIKPVGDLPLLCKKNNGKIVTVNLQRTHNERKVDLVINGKLDDVFYYVMKNLNIEVEVSNYTMNQVKPTYESVHPLEFLLERRSGAKRK